MFYLLSPRFSKQVYDDCDTPAKDALIQYLTPRVRYVEKEPHGRYGVDLLVQYNNGRKVFFECEKRYSWKVGKFPYDTIHIPSRKQKFLNLEYPTYFASFRDDLKALIILNSQDIKNQSMVEVSNYRMRSGEEFYNIPLGLAKYVDLSTVV